MKRTDFSFQLKGWLWLAAFLAAFAPSSARAQCALACTNLVQVSLDQDCSVAITPAMILQPGSSCPGGQLSTIVCHPNGQPIAGSPIVNANHIGLTLMVKVQDGVSGNSCWGNILVEDKLKPQVTCPPIHVYCNWPDITPSYLAAYGVPNAWPTVMENCGTYTWTWSDETFSVPCGGSHNGVTGITGYVKRSWIVTDASGNHTVCDQFIYFDKKETTDVDWPSDVTLECDGYDLDPSATGIPTIDFVPLWPDPGFCWLNLQYADQEYPVCNGSFKILRTWTVFDECRPISPTNPLTHIQVIKVLDTHGPEFACPTNLTISTDAFSCSKDWAVPKILMRDVCATVKSAKLTYMLPNWQTATLNATFAQVPDPNNPWAMVTQATFGTANDLPLGPTNVTITATDDCGNNTVCNFILTVADLVPPVAVCDEITQISLGTDGLANVPAATFDDGSYDNCNQVWFKVRRMDSNPCEINNVFRPKAKFCCSDRNDTVQVILRVYDVNPGAGDVALDAFEGHYNECMIQVYVEDKIRPICSAPAHVTTTCEIFDPSLWSYGQATAEDNCCLDGITTSVNYSQFDTTCNRGIITRTFTAKDCGGQTSRCTQTITVNYINDYAVKFPDDLTVTTCNGTANYGKPTILQENCELVAVNYTDQIYNLVPDACYKIVRTWSVINWCQHDPNQPLTHVTNPSNSDLGPTVDADNVNGLQYVQIIKVIDQVKPLFAGCASGTKTFCDYTVNDPQLFNSNDSWDPVHETHDLCEGLVDLQVLGSDACSGKNVDIRYVIFADLTGDGVLETTINSANNSLGFGVAIADSADWRKGRVTRHNSTAFELPYGLHKIKWFISDGCGNETTCEYSFLIKDCKNPTVVCKPLSINIMNSNPPMIDIWASDFVEYAFDNCTPEDQLVYRMRIAGTGTGYPTTSGLNFDCTQVGPHSIEVWAKDKSGNADYCTTYLLVQDNAGNCDSSSQTSANVSGFILTDQSHGLEEAEVKLTGSAPGFPAPGMLGLTNVSGEFNFSGLPVASDYELAAKKDVNPTNGVSTFDLVLISKHILGSEPFGDAVCKWIAADVNKSNSVSTADVVELRKVILGILPSFPSNESWRFFSKSYAWQNPTAPLGETWPEKVTVANANDFTAVKIGDINGNASANNLMTVDDRSPVGTLFFDVKNEKIAAGDEFTVDFTAAEKVAGYQFTLRFDGLEALEIMPAKGQSKENFGVFAAENAITTSFDGSEKGQFSVRFRAQKGGNVSDLLSLSSYITPVEAYTEKGEKMAVALRFAGEKGQTTVAGLGFELYQNEPNPVKDRSTIKFYLPEAGAATLKITDANGRQLLSKKGEFAAGYNAFTISREALSAGILFYEVETASGSATRKMIALD